MVLESGCLTPESSVLDEMGLKQTEGEKSI